jgi:ArsR family transcriptional regulator
MNQSDLSTALKAVAVPSRLRIMELLRGHSYCVNALTMRLGISQPAVSQHLGILRRAGLVRANKVGTMVHYKADVDRFRELLKALEAIGDVGDWTVGA